MTIPLDRDATISPPARAALEKRIAAMQRADKRAESFRKTYQPIVAALSETEFRGILMAVSEEAVVRQAIGEGKEKWHERLIEENQ
jgi:anti-sigma factor RsiW